MTPQIVEEEYFRRWITYVNPSVKLDYDLTKRYCLRYYEDAKGKVKDLLNNMDKSIALSVDLLTHYEYFGPSHDFLCLTAHFIDDNWKLKKLVLRFQEHNTMEFDFINVAILKSLRDWDILDKVANITSRGAHDEIFVSEVLGTIKDEINEKKMRQLNSCFFAVPCVAEMFSLMAQDAFNSVEKTIDKIKELSWSKSLSMWHTTHYEIKNALDLLALGEFDSESVRKDYDVPSTEEWDNVKIVHRLVERMHNVAKLVFETKYSTSNKFLYNLQELQEILIKESNCEYYFTGNLAKKMLERLEKYLKDMFLLLAIASVMDPRLKMQYIEYISSKFDDINGSFQSGPVLEAVRSLYAEYSNHEKKTKFRKFLQMLKQTKRKFLVVIGFKNSISLYKLKINQKSLSLTCIWQSQSLLGVTISILCNGGDLKVPSTQLLPKWPVTFWLFHYQLLHHMMLTTTWKIDTLMSVSLI